MYKSFFIFERGKKALQMLFSELKMFCEELKRSTSLYNKVSGKTQPGRQRLQHCCPF